MGTIQRQIVSYAAVAPFLDEVTGNRLQARREKDRVCSPDSVERVHPGQRETTDLFGIPVQRLLYPL